MILVILHCYFALFSQVDDNCKVNSNDLAMMCVMSDKSPDKSTMSLRSLSPSFGRIDLLFALNYIYLNPYFLLFP